MTGNAKSNSPVLVQQAKTKAKAMPLYNKTHLFYLVTSMVMLSGIFIAASF
jgi:hypothetical protein